MQVVGEHLVFKTTSGTSDVPYPHHTINPFTYCEFLLQMANAARTMGMGGSENNPNYKVEIKTGKIERIAAPPAVLQPLRRGEQGLDQESADYLSSADASILAQYYGDR